MWISFRYQSSIAKDMQLLENFLVAFLSAKQNHLIYEILTARLIDRALRPLFPDDFHAEIQVIITLISADNDVMPDALACLAASAAIAVSDIPFNGPISEVRVVRTGGKFIVNPSKNDDADNARYRYDGWCFNG